MELTGEQVASICKASAVLCRMGRYDEARVINALLAAHNAGVQPKGAGMQAQMIASRICSALEADKDDGYDLEAGLFGKALSALIRELAAMSLSAGAQEPVAWPYEITRGHIECLIADHQRDGQKHLKSRLNSSGSYLIRVAESFRWCLEQIDAAKSNAQPQPMPKTDAARDAIELLRKFMEYRDSDYVPNVLFDRARTVIDRAKGE